MPVLQHSPPVSVLQHQRGGGYGGLSEGGRLTSYRPNHNSTGPGPFCAQFTSVRYALVAASGVKEAITGFDRVW